MRLRVALSLSGAALTVGGVAVVFWPAALILAGISLLAFGLLTHAREG